MPQDINLIPKEILKERSVQSAQNSFVLFSLSLIVVSIILSVIAGVLATNSSASLTSIKSEVNQKENKIKTLNEVEKLASNLQQRLAFIKSVFDSKTLYSKIITEIEQKNITGIAVTNVDVTPEYTISIKGISSSTSVLQNYIKNISSENSLFLDLKIMEVSINEGKGIVDFKIDATVDKKQVLGF